MVNSAAANAKIQGVVWVGLLVAAGVSIGAILLAAGPDRRAVGLATSPFGWNRVIVVHALASIMLSWWVARTIAARQPALVVRWKATIWAAAGLAAAGLTIAAGPAIQQTLDGLGTGYTARLLSRVAWCTVLQVPWCMAALAVANTPATRCRPIFSSRGLLALALVTALGVPVSYLAVFLEQQTAQALAQWQQERFVQAEKLAQRLCDVGSTRSLGERATGNASGGADIEVTPGRALADLDRLVTLVRKRADQLAVASPSDTNRLQLAQCYLALDQPDQAVATLEPVAARVPSAALMIAHIKDRQGHPAASQKWAEQALKTAQQAKPADAAAADKNETVELDAYDMLAILAGKKGDFTAAEHYLLEALERLPDRSAEIHDRLAKHYEFVGDLVRARAHQSEAARRRPKKYPEPESLLTKILATGAPVGLARPKSSRYQ